MGLVTIEAVLHDRRMLPEERTAPFGMALITGLVDRGCDQELRIGRAMRVVATGAGHRSLAQRHVRGALELRLAHGMAVQADLHLGSLREQHVVGQRLGEAGGGNERRPVLMYLVARDASQAPRLVGAASPEQSLPLFVALQTARVLVPGGEWRVLTEAENEFSAPGSLVGHPLGTRAIVFARLFHVLTPRSVTGFAALRFQIAFRGIEERLGHLCGGEPPISLPVAFLASLAANVCGLIRTLGPCAERRAGYQESHEQRFRRMSHSHASRTASGPAPHSCSRIADTLGRLAEGRSTSAAKSAKQY